MRIPFEGHAQIDSRNYLIAGDGNQTSAVEAWAATPAEMALPPLRCDGSAVEAWAATPAEMPLPPLRCDGSVDLARLRHWEWHTGFLEQVRSKNGRLMAAMGQRFQYPSSTEGACGGAYLAL